MDITIKNKNKKGIFFTAAVIVIIALLGISYLFYSTLKERESVQERVTTMNNYLFSLEKDMQRQLYISGFRAVFVIEKEITETGLFVPDASQAINELFFNGTINSKPQDIMAGATFGDIQNSILTNSEKINTIANLSSPSIEISQIDPWNIHLVLSLNLKLSDKENLASWDKTETIEAFIPIENFEDPLYALNTNSLVTNNITRTPYATFDISNLTIHAQNSYYKASAKAPSFLERLEGKTSANENGVESFVNLQKISSQGLPIKEKSCIDYIYFSSNNPSASHVSGMPSWFMIDDEHKPDYNLS
jgi:hypothetical protein